MAGSSMFMTLEEVMEELQIDKAELDQLTADGKLSPIRDAGKLKFRRKQVDAIKLSTETEATVVFEPGQLDGQEESSDDVFLVGSDSSSDTASEEATVISIPESQAALDDEDTSKVEMATGEEAEEDSDQTSIIPPSSDNVAPEKKEEEEESIFAFGDEGISADNDSGKIIEAKEDPSSDVLSVEDDSAIGPAATETSDSQAPTSPLSLSDESDDALASVEIDASATDASTESEEIAGDLLDTVDATAEESAADLLGGEEGLETADTIDLTAADDDATATVEEVLDEEADATEAGLLAGGEETEAGVAVGDDGYGSDGGYGGGGPATAPELVVPEEFVFGPPPASPIMTSLLVVGLVAMLLAGTYLVNTIMGVELPVTQWATNMARDMLAK